MGQFSLVKMAATSITAQENKGDTK